MYYCGQACAPPPASPYSWLFWQRTLDYEQVGNAQASQLYLSGTTTTISGQTYNGSVREVNPGTGTTGWATGLGCRVLGTPALDAATNVLAVATWNPCRSGSPAV